jgi:hypothetical protein
VIRDPRDVAVSRLFQRVRTAVNPNIAVAGDPLYYLTVDEVAQLWQQGSDRVKRFSADAPGVLHELRYEDLLERFHSTVQSVLEFFDVEASSEILAEIERRTRFEIMSGGRARGDADAGSFFRKGIAGDWRNHLDEKAISIIEVRCGALMDTYGYERAQRT